VILLNVIEVILETKYELFIEYHPYFFAIDFFVLLFFRLNMLSGSGSASGIHGILHRSKDESGMLYPP
jgi:hypothetical protein